MSPIVITITDSRELSRTIDRYLMACLRSEPDHRFMTYGNRGALNPESVRCADLFILELLRQNHLGFRAEAIPTARIWAEAGKRVLIVSGSAKADGIAILAYWDLGSRDSLKDRIEEILSRPPEPASELDRVAAAFERYCRLPTPHPQVWC